MHSRYKVDLLLSSDLPDSSLDFAEIFGRTAPLQIEIGSGKGAFLLAQARAFPSVNFLGIEWAKRYCRFAADRMQRWGLTNVRLIRTEAADFIARRIPPRSVEMFHLYFPDPWPKRSHHKRRIYNTEILAGMLLALRPGGIISMATDHEGYFAQMTEVSQAAFCDGRAEPIPFIPPAGAKNGEIVGTNYERKYRKEGRTVYAMALRKR